MIFGISLEAFTELTASVDHSMCLSTYSKFIYILQYWGLSQDADEFSQRWAHEALNLFVTCDSKSLIPKTALGGGCPHLEP